MLTLKQYQRMEQDRLIAKHGCTRADAMLADHETAREWRDYVVHSFNDGEDIPTRLWRSMDEGLRYRVLRTPRALKDDALTRKLTDSILSDFQS